MRILLFLFLLFSATAQSANHYIRDGGSGSLTGTGDCADWTTTHACDDFPATLVRGDTYYIAGGSYPSHTFGSLSGTSYVFLQKATVAVHGTATGWLDSYASTVATFSSSSSVFTIHMTNLSIDGVTGSGTSGHGIKLTTTGTTQGGGATIYSYNSAPDGLLLKHLELEAPAPNGSLENFNVDSHVWPGADGQVISYCYIHGGLVSVLVTGSNEIIEHSVLQNAGGQQHSEIIDAANVQNLTIRWNVLENLVCCDGTTYIEPQVNGGLVPNGIYIYGNIVKATRSDEATNNPSLLSSTSGEQVLNVFIYNNTVYGLHGPTPPGAGFQDSGVRGDNAGSTITVRNNIWDSNTYDPQFQAVQVQDHNILNTGGVSFVNAGAGDFHLATNTAAGANLGSPYDVDPDGVTRTTWSRGAFEFTSGVPSAPTNFRFISLLLGSVLLGLLLGGLTYVGKVGTIRAYYRRAVLPRLSAHRASRRGVSGQKTAQSVSGQEG